MNLGSRVASQKIGPPLVGEVFGFVNAGHWARMSGLTFPQWTELYPDWLEGRVVFIYSKVAQKGMTFEEYLDTLFDGPFDVDWIKQMALVDYETMVGTSNYFVLPEADLVLMEQLNENSTVEAGESGT
jgi:hypothetical protein